MSTPPKPGQRPSVRVDQQLSDDLATLMVAGGTVSDAVRHAVSVVAASYRYAWQSGHVPEGVEPIVGGCVMRCPTPAEQRLTRPGGRPAPASDADTAASDTASKAAASVRQPTDGR